jgi:hypothetical protein
MPAIHQLWESEEKAPTASSWLGALRDIVNPRCQYGVRLSGHGPLGLGCDGCRRHFEDDWHQHQAEAADQERNARVREMVDAFKIAIRELMAEEAAKEQS